MPKRSRSIRRIFALSLSALLITALYPAAQAAAVTVTRRESWTLGGELLYTSQTAVHASAGTEEERILELPAGSGLTPMVVSGDYVYNANLTISQAAARLTARGYTVVAGLNADFYNTSYYTPIGLSIEDGRLLTTGSTTAVGFTSDGRVLIDMPNPAVRFIAHGKTYVIDEVNRVRGSGKLYLYTPDFSANTRTNQQGRIVVITMPEGAALRVGQAVTGVVKSVMDTAGAYTIGANEFVLAATSEAEIARTDGLAPGDAVTFTVSVSASKADWANVTYACGGLNRLITNGVAAKPGTSLAPRTAVGLKADGTAVFLTVDGRQSGYSHGLSLNQMAERMAELGCVQALELDGGGSTAMGVVYPGLDSFSVVNQPSDGGLRKCKNYIFFVNEKPAAGIPAQLHLYTDYSYIYQGSAAEFDVRATDEAGHSVALTGAAIQLSADGGEPLETGSIRLNKTGAIQINAALGEAAGSRTVTVTDTLDTLAVHREDQGRSVSELAVQPGDTVDLTAIGSRGGHAVAIDDDVVSWSVSPEVGAVTADGLFTASAGTRLRSGVLTVSVGGRTVTVLVRVNAQALVLDSFESGKPPAGGTGITASFTETFIQAARGQRALALDYDLTSGGTAALPLNYTLKNKPGYVAFYLCGDGSGHTLSLQVRDTGGAVHTVTAAPLTETEYRLYYVTLPPDAAALTGLTLTAAGEGNTNAGQLRIDHLVQAWNIEYDVDAPLIEEREIVVAGEKQYYRMTVIDDGFPIPKAQISVTINGAAASFTYDPEAALLELAVPAAAPDGYTVIIMTATDAFGNYAKRVYTRTGNPASGGPADADDCSWGADMLRMLDAKNRLMTQTVDGRRLFAPNQAVTRVEIYEMALHFMGIDAAQYDHIELPFIDLAGVSESELRAARAAYAMGLLFGQGSKDGLLLGAHDRLTRADFCVIAARLIPQGMYQSQPAFSDTAQIPGYARTAVGTMAANNIVLGVGHNQFKPKDPVTRAQVAKVLMNLLW